MFSKSKGITPVIAIVLLLLITIGAVGVVYTQFQSLVGNPADKLNQQKVVQNTELTFSSAYKNDNGGINVTLRNTGSQTVNMSKQFEMKFVPENSESGIDYTTYDKAVGNTVGQYECFQNNQGLNELLDPGQSYTCETGVSFPAPTKSVGIIVSFKTAAKSWSHTCSPSTSGSVTC